MFMLIIITIITIMSSSNIHLNKESLREVA